jgi:hypothetical protein
MSYPVDLEEVTTQTLVSELARRKNNHLAGKCHYCGRDLKSDPPCKMTNVHSGRDTDGIFT